MPGGSSVTGRLAAMDSDTMAINTLKALNSAAKDHAFSPVFITGRSCVAMAINCK